MSTDSPFLGRTLRSSTTTFTFGCAEADSAVPNFGALVRSDTVGLTLYGLVYEVIIQDDPFVRQIVAASDELDETRVQDMRQRRQAPVEVTALAIAYSGGQPIYQRIPPRPPRALEPVFACDEHEIRLVLARFDYFRTVLNYDACPSEELLAASLRQAADCQVASAGDAYKKRAGRELARLLAMDLPRLDAILRRIV